MFLSTLYTGNCRILLHQVISSCSIQMSCFSFRFYFSGHFYSIPPLHFFGDKVYITVGLQLFFPYSCTILFYLSFFWYFSFIGSVFVLFDCRFFVVDQDLVLAYAYPKTFDVCCCLFHDSCCLNIISSFSSTRSDLLMLIYYCVGLPMHATN